MIELVRKGTAMLNANGRELPGRIAAAYPTAARLSCVLGMFSSLEVKVLRPS